jgi:hypothetical protein
MVLGSAAPESLTSQGLSPGSQPEATFLSPPPQEPLLAEIHPTPQLHSDTLAKIRTGRPKSEVWAFFTPVGERKGKTNRSGAHCNFCPFEVKDARVDNLLKHIAAECPSTTEETREQARALITKRAAESAATPGKAKKVAKKEGGQPVATFYDVGGQQQLVPEVLGLINGTAAGLPAVIADLRSDTLTRPTPAMRQAMFTVRTGNWWAELTGGSLPAARGRPKGSQPHIPVPACTRGVCSAVTAQPFLKNGGLPGRSVLEARSPRLPVIRVFRVLGSGVLPVGADAQPQAQGR